MKPQQHSDRFGKITCLYAGEQGTELVLDHPDLPWNRQVNNYEFWGEKSGLIARIQAPNQREAWKIFTKKHASSIDYIKGLNKDD